MIKNFADKYTAIFGGTFDPPHLGHRQVAQDLIQILGVSRVLVVPSARPPHKTTLSSSVDRLKMCELLFAGLSGVEVNDLELKREASGRPSYSIDTILELKSQFPKLAFIIGSDQIESLPTWHRFQELLGLCDWIAVGRKPDGLNRNLAAIQQLVGLGLARSTASDQVWALSRGHTLRQLETRAPDMSSTEIRRQIAVQTVEKTAILDDFLSKYLPTDVTRYLMDRKLYGT